MKTTSYLIDIGHFADKNEMYSSDQKPAHTTVEARPAHPELSVEIEAVTVISG